MQNCERRQKDCESAWSSDSRLALKVHNPSLRDLDLRVDASRSGDVGADLDSRNPDPLIDSKYRVRDAHDSAEPAKADAR